MAQPQVVIQPVRRKRSRNLKKDQILETSSPKRIDAFTLASIFQKKEEKREFLYGWISLLMKLGLLAIFSASLVKLGVASQQRVRRQVELASILDWETVRLQRLNRRFDQLFTIGGERRFMTEQDHWIAPNSFRVIWR